MGLWATLKPTSKTSVICKMEAITHFESYENQKQGQNILNTQSEVTHMVFFIVLSL